MGWMIVLGILFVAIPIAVAVVMFIDEGLYFSAFILAVMGLLGVILLTVFSMEMYDEHKSNYEQVTETFYRKIN